MPDIFQALTTEAFVAVFIILALCAALVVSFRRKQRNGYKMNARVVREESPVPDYHDRSSRELPNGGARPVGRQEPTFGEYVDDASSSTGVSAPVSPESPWAVAEKAKLTADRLPGIDESLDETKENKADTLVDPGTLDWLDEIEAIPAAQGQPAALPRHEDTTVYSLNVMARAEQGFAGDDVLRVLLGCGLRFGDMDFFHLSQAQGGKPTIQFSVANMMQPGVFDLEGMTTLHTKGLMFFLTLPGPEEMVRAFDLMLETAHTVAHSLGGDVYDETRSVMTKQYVESLRQSIREYENNSRAEKLR
jgi:cell division protein ZipA